MTYAPLEGVRVLELARLLPGAMVTRKFADLGAEVVKVEEPGRGDYLRWFPPMVDGASVLFNTVNRGKKSIELDMKTPAGVEQFLALADVADVIVEGSRPGAFAKRGLHWPDVRQRNPRLVICSVSGFGQSGPLSTLPSHGYVMDSLAGCMTLGPDADGHLRSVGAVSWTVELGTASAAFTTLAAVVHAKNTGEGAWIDASLWDASVEAQRSVFAPILAGEDPYGTISGPLGSAYTASDGKPVMLVAIEQVFWANFCRGVGREDLIEGWGGAGTDEQGIVALGEERLREEIASIIATAPAAVWTDRFVEWSVAGAMVVDPSELADLPHFAARGLVRKDLDPNRRMPIVGDPMLFLDPEFRPGIGSTPPPALGADTDEVLATWLSK